MQYALIAANAVSAYPYTLEQFRQDQAARSQQGLRSTSLPQTPTDAQLAEAGIYPVTIAALPDLAEGQKLDGYTVAKVGGIWTQQWVVASADLGETKTAKLAAIKDKQLAVQMAGWTHDFGAEGTHTLDLRDADDKANWILLLTKTSGMVAAGSGAAPVNIRTAENETIVVSATDARAAMLAFLAWGEVLLSAKWALDAAVIAATDTAAVAAIDINAGWPS
jgi:hypothetical protein